MGPEGRNEKRSSFRLSNEWTLMVFRGKTDTIFSGCWWWLKINDYGHGQEIVSCYALARTIVGS